MTSAVFSKLKSVSSKPFGRIAILAAKTKTKVGPYLPRSSTVVGTAKVSVAIAATLGLSVPHMQGMYEAAKQILSIINPIQPHNTVQGWKSRIRVSNMILEQ